MSEFAELPIVNIEQLEFKTRVAMHLLTSTLDKLPERERLFALQQLMSIYLDDVNVCGWCQRTFKTPAAAAACARACREKDGV